MICQVCIAFFFFFLLAMSGAFSRCRSTDPCYPNRCMLYWCSEPVYKWSASLTMAGANCYWRLKACWKRPPTNRPPDIAALFLTSNPCRICCCAYRVNESACDTDLNMGICGAHTCPCSQSRLRDTKDCPRTASFVGVRAVFFLFFDASILSGRDYCDFNLFECFGFQIKGWNVKEATCSIVFWLLLTLCSSSK